MVQYYLVHKIALFRKLVCICVAMCMQRVHVFVSIPKAVNNCILLDMKLYQPIKQMQ